MESLRKLDRKEFERKLAVTRSLRVKPYQLQSMLRHFDNLDDGEPDSEDPAELPPAPEVLAARLVTQFLRNGEGPEVAAELADYAPTVNPYFDQGPQQRQAILKDITDYRRQWPRRSLRLARIESARRDDIENLDATYRLQYTASDGKRTRSGSLIQSIHYTLSGGRWQVSGIQTIEKIAE